MYFKTYKIYVGEEGWYVYKQPNNMAVRAIRHAGPFKKEDAEKMVVQLNR